jgi:hypothetical protein
MVNSTGAVRQKLSMSCWIEERRDSADRKASWHETCAIPSHCRCPAHATDKEPR